MAFSADDFKTHFVADGRSVHYYTTADSEATVVAADYFASEYTKVNVGDFIHALVATGGTPAVVTLGVLTSASGGLTVAVLT